MELGMLLSSADAAVRHAQDVRAAHRKRSSRGALTRETDISFALDRLKRTMRPIRSELARMPYLMRKAENQDEVEKLGLLRELLVARSLDIQRERRKLWKMRDKKRRKNARKR